MKKFISTLTASLVLTTALAGFSTYDNKDQQSFKSFSFFPAFTLSPAIEFEESDNENDRVKVVEQKEKVKIKFKIIEWFEELF